MNPVQATKAYNYVRRYGKNWTQRQVCLFFIEVAKMTELAKVGR